MTRARHAELFDAEYAKQLERIERIRTSITAGLPAAQRPEGHVEILPSRPSWDAAPMDLAPAPPRPAAQRVVLRQPAAETAAAVAAAQEPHAPVSLAWLWAALLLVALGLGVALVGMLG